MGTPGVSKSKAKIIGNSSNLDMSAKNEYKDDSSYMTVDRKNGRNKRSCFESENYSEIISNSSKNIKERSTITPSRYGVRNQLRPIKFSPKAFKQPDAEEQRDLVVNLEDIVKEENAVFKIQELIRNKLSVEALCKEWWALTEVSSVKEMQLFFEEDDSRKLIR